MGRIHSMELFDCVVNIWLFPFSNFSLYIESIMSRVKVLCTDEYIMLVSFPNSFKITSFVGGRDLL